jgi:hypothetical protein
MAVAFIASGALLDEVGGDHADDRSHRDGKAAMA